MVLPGPPITSPYSPLTIGFAQTWSCLLKYLQEFNSCLVIMTVCSLFLLLFYWVVMVVRVTIFASYSNGLIHSFITSYRDGRRSVRAASAAVSYTHRFPSRCHGWLLSSHDLPRTSNVSYGLPARRGEVRLLTAVRCT